MDTRKVTFIATIAAIILVAVGIGYAYTAVTTNSGNSASAEYLTIVQGGNGDYQFSDGSLVYWDSNDYKITDSADPYVGGDIAVGDLITVFKLTGNTTTITPEATYNYTMVQVGDSFTLKFAPQTGGQPISGLLCSLTSDAFALPGAGTEIIVKINNGVADKYFKLTEAKTFKGWNTSSHDWTITPATFEVRNAEGVYADATVTVYYGYSGDKGIAIEHASGAHVGPSATPVSGASLKFTADTTWKNNDPITAFELSKDNMTIAGTGSDTATITFTPTTANRGMSVVSSNTAVATVTYDSANGIIKVTGVAAGSAAITITPASGSVAAKTRMSSV
jgi:hypothetical protein